MAEPHKTPEQIADERVLEALASHATELDLGWLGLTALPESISELRDIQELRLFENRLAALPESITQLQQLKSLRLWGNRLRALPESIGHLKLLELLDISRNALTALPESIGELSQLRELYAWGNQLTALPGSIGKLGRLQRLSLSENKLQALPESLQELAVLEALYLHGNEKLGIPLEVLGPGWGHVQSRGAAPADPANILLYYFRTSAGSRPLNEAKLILVGRGNVGKTCIVNRLERDVFEDTSKTQGISITLWPIWLKDEEDVRLHVWDFGGQEIMHATHQFFLTERSLYLLVLNGRQGGEDAEAEYWLQLIESFGGDAPVIVVLNKIRETPFDLNRRALQGKYPTVREFIRVDCNPPVGIDDLRRAIHREIDVLTGLRTSFPASWVTIKDRLSNMAERGENYISFERYRELCAELGEKEPLLQEALAGYLHVLGIALNYKDDPRLQDINVLSPHWVTNGIYKILNWPELEANKGVLRLRDLSGVLDPNAYPAAKHMFLLDLMKKFEICFEFPDDPERRYLLPELLGKEDPPGLEGEFDPAQCLNFEYDYNILPEGLLPRFIVRTHRLSEGNARWRTGVILQFEGNRALVKADLHDRKTVISVTGPAAGRRRLLAVIRSDLERIHADIRRLRVTEMVPLGRTDWVVRYSELTVLEKRGILKHQRVFDDKLVELNVRELLDGLDIEGSRSREGELDRPGEAVKVFYSYSHKDEALRDELETHLKLLQRQGVISFWDDRKIAAGEEWKAAINKNLEAAEIILLLISPDFIASDYSYEKEMSRALERHEAGRAQVIPVILRAVDWRSAPFGKLQALPKNGRPVKSWPDTDCAWKDVALGIREAAKARRR